MLWWVFAKGGLLRFSSLWRAILLFTATGLFFLPVIGSAWAGWALVLISIAQTLVVMLFWTMLADVAHHSRTSPYVIFGSGWIAYSLPFALGELAGKAEGLHGAGSAVLLALAYLLTIAAVFALNEANFSQRRIFADLEDVYKRQEHGCVVRHCHVGHSRHELLPVLPVSLQNRVGCGRFGDGRGHQRRRPPYIRDDVGALHDQATVSRIRRCA